MEIIIGRNAQNGQLNLLSGNKTGVYGTPNSVPRSVSRRHCRIEVLPNGTYSVENLKMENDTYVNGNPICVNKNGDRIKYGAARLRTYYEGLYVDGDIAMSKVNSYYFVGLDIKSTITGIRMTTKSVDENGYKQYSCTVVHDDVAKAGEEGWIGGDGMVCYYASLAGEDIEALRENGHLIELPNFWHADVGGCWLILGDYVYKYIGELAKE